MLYTQTLYIIHEDIWRFYRIRILIFQRRRGVSAMRLQNWPGYDRALFTLPARFWRQTRRRRRSAYTRRTPLDDDDDDDDVARLLDDIVCTTRGRPSGTNSAARHRESSLNLSLGRVCIRRHDEAEAVVPAATVGGRGAVWDRY